MDGHGLHSARFISSGRLYGSKPSDGIRVLQKRRVGQVCFYLNVKDVNKKTGRDREGRWEPKRG